MNGLTEEEIIFNEVCREYLKKLHGGFTDEILAAIEALARELKEAWIRGSHVYICGNGGSAANAIHIANDLHYGVGACGVGAVLPGLKVVALASNSAIITCLANDTGYENIYAHQIDVLGQGDDILIVLSGSGNSKNILKAVDVANKMGMKTFAILGFDGGECKGMANVSIHIEIDDMQIAEDTQLVIGHLCMQWLSRNKPMGLIGRK